MLTRRGARLAATVVLFCLFTWRPAYAQAPSLNIKSWTGPGPGGATITIIFTTPNGYGSCPTGETSDTIRTTGVPATWVLRGAVQVLYVTNTGPQEVNRYDINQYGNLTLQVKYPPSCLWPRLDTQFGPVFEIVVNVAIEVYDGDPFAGGLKVAWVGGDPNAPGTLGPGQAWSLWCYTPPPCAGGCTPGFWKQAQHFDVWPSLYQPTSPFEGIFNVDVPGTPSMLDALTLGGGGLNALMRHAAAALLNSQSTLMSFGMTSAQVVEAFRQAVLSGNIEATKNTFDDMNNVGCPLK